MVESFAPHINLHSQVIVLGSMPGVRSLTQQEYYANPQNAFWWIMESLFDISRDDPYEARMSQLLERRVGLWDVLASCHREGSLDSKILSTEQVPNNIVDLLAAHPSIRHIVLNGKSVASLFKRHFKEAELCADIHILPSTSPANARLTREDKREQWKIIKVFLED